MFRLLKKKPQKIEGSQAYASTTSHYRLIPIHYPPTEEFTECDMKSFKQLFDMRITKRTCGSFHSRLSALA